MSVCVSLPVSLPGCCAGVEGVPAGRGAAMEINTVWTSNSQEWDERTQYMSKAETAGKKDEGKTGWLKREKAVT